MELKLIDGDYTKSVYHDLDSLGDADELAQRLTMKLVAHRGGFALMPNFGSELYKLVSLKQSERNVVAKAYIADALSDENVEIGEIDVYEEDDTIMLSVVLNYAGDDIYLNTEI